MYCYPQKQHDHDNGLPGFLIRCHSHGCRWPSAGSPRLCIDHRHTVTENVGAAAARPRCGCGHARAATAMPHASPCSTLPPSTLHTHTLHDIACASKPAPQCPHDAKTPAAWRTPDSAVVGRGLPTRPQRSRQEGTSAMHGDSRGHGRRQRCLQSSRAAGACSNSLPALE